jgi:hypothetical protein
VISGHLGPAGTEGEKAGRSHTLQAAMCLDSAGSWPLEASYARLAQHACHAVNLEARTLPRASIPTIGAVAMPNRLLLLPGAT